MIIEPLQKFFLFLSRDNGLLFTRSVEFLIFSFITYIVVSEYLKRRTSELRISSLAFGLFSLEKFMMTLFLFFKIFAGLSTASYEFWLPLLDTLLETLALIVLANAIVYPVLGKWKQRAFLPPLLFLGIVYILSEVLWILELVYQPGGEFDESLLFFTFLIIKSAILLLPLYLTATASKRQIRYRFQIFAALLIYFITQFLLMMNYVFYHSGSGRLLVAAVPFPVLSALLFFRVVYLRAADTEQLDQQLRSYEQKLRHEHEIGRMKDELVSVVSHELRTPLTSVMLYTDLLLKGRLGRILPKQAKALNLIKSEQKRLSSLIEDNLTLSRLESGKALLRLSEFNLYNLCQSHGYQPLAARKHIRIINRVPKGFSLVVDPAQFTQVFTNLLSNAIKYTEDRGEIYLDAKTLGNGWEFSVTDTGIGIPQDKIPHLFDKFYRVESYMTRTYSGTGLGLAIIKKIVEMHGGKVRVNSTPKKGSTFTVFIPKPATGQNPK